jgi:phage terminase large subunit
MLPEYAQARKAIWDAVNPHTGKRRIDEAFPQELRKTTRNQEMMIEFRNGSSWQVVGSDNYNSLVGSTPAGIVYSEWALADPSARAYLRPILAENGGWQVFITTARGRNHAHKTYTAALKDPKAFAQILPATQTGIFTPERLEEERLAYIGDFGEEYGQAKFDQEYLCSFDAANLGAILARAIGKLEALGRIGPHVQYDPLGAPIEISADIGRRDSATWYFWQPKVGGYSIVDYDGGWGTDAEEWADKLADKLVGRKLGKIWLPHDARAKTFAAKHSAVEVFIKKFGSDKIGITPDSRKSDRINAARAVIGRCEFSDKCEDGLNGLRSWQFEYNEETKTFGLEPKHDWASHDGDGFSYGCLIMQMTKPLPKEPEPRYPIKGTSSGVIQTATLDEMWALAPKKNGRL